MQERLLGEGCRRGLWREGCRRDCWERDAGGDCGERDAGGTVGRDCGERDAGGLWENSPSPVRGMRRPVGDQVKTNVISAATEKTSPACWSVSGNLYQRVGTALRNDITPECFLFVFSSNPDVLCLRWEEERRERGGELYGETSSGRYTVAQFHARIGI